jgi:hypothetical protein
MWIDYPKGYPLGLDMSPSSGIQETTVIKPKTNHLSESQVRIGTTVKQSPRDSSGVRDQCWGRVVG